MIKEQRIIIAECDLQKGDECWEEITLGLEPEETIDDALNFLRELEWKCDPSFYVEGEDIKVHCPYCENGKLKPEEDELYLTGYENRDPGELLKRPDFDLTGLKIKK